MRRTFIWIAAIATAAGLSACRSSTATVPVARGPVTVVSGKPTEVYSQVARQIRGCWLKPSDPVLTKHTFHAEAAPDGSATNIAIHERTTDGKRGLKAFTVVFQPRDSRNTTVVAENHRLPYALGQVLVADVGRWASGDSTCAAAISQGPSRGSGTPSGVSQRIYDPQPASPGAGGGRRGSY
ncbi:MAG: hypothetical protein ACR2PO_00715 [Methyloligellaceae bacterium]